MPTSVSLITIDPTWQPYAPGQVITYSFLTAAPADYRDTASAGYLNGFTAFSSVQQAATRKIMDVIESIANATFVQLANGATADIRLGNTTQPSSGGANIRYQPFGSSPRINDILLSNGPVDNTGASLGGYGFVTITHEILHALGLKHPQSGVTTDATVTTSSSVMA